MNARKRIAIAAAAVVTGMCASASVASAATNGAVAAGQPNAHVVQSAAASSSWKCREATASARGARVSAAICWQGHTAKVAGQIYDTLADHRSACVQISKGYSGNWNICDHKGAGSSMRFVTGEFGYQEPVNIMACAENTLSPAICSGWH